MNKCALGNQYTMTKTSTELLLELTNDNQVLQEYQLIDGYKQDWD